MRGMRPKAARTRRGNLVFIGIGQREGKLIARARKPDGIVIEKEVTFSQVIGLKNARIQAKLEVIL